MSEDIGKKYTLKIEAEALSYRGLLYAMIDILDNINTHEGLIKDSGLVMTHAAKDGTSFRFDVTTKPWETK